MFHEAQLNNPTFNDCYFSYDDGVAEALYVFVDGNNLIERFRSEEMLIIGETGFGTGLNLVALIFALQNAGITGRTINFYSVEKYPLTVERIRELTGRVYESIEPQMNCFLDTWKSVYPSLTEGWNLFSFTVDSIEVQCFLFYGDVLPYLESITVKPDAWFLDGHSPDKNPDMWNERVMGMIGKNSHISTTLSTFSAAGVVKEGLRKGGIFIRRRKGFGGKRHMITGHRVETDQDA